MSEALDPATPLIEALAAISAALGSRAISTNAATLDATSHDTWPMTTKWARLDRHPYRADAVVRATSTEQVAVVLRAANASGVPVTTRAGASSVTGQPLPTRGGIVLDVAGLEGERRLDETDFIVTAPASTNGGELEEWLGARGYTLGHSPQSLYRSTIGGWLATLATGQFSSRYGGIEDLVQGYTVVLADGTVARLAAKPRAAMGPDLRQLFLGSEGTLGVITDVSLRVFPRPDVRLLETYAVPDVTTGLALMRDIAATGLRPFLVRFYDRDEARHAMGDPRFATPVMFVGTEGLAAVAEAEFAAIAELADARGCTPLGPGGAEAWMGRRFDFSSVENALARPGGWAETIEVAHTWSQIEALYRDMRCALLPFADEVLSHFSHLYVQGTSMYVILFGRSADDAAAVATLEQVWARAMEVCLAHGAELSHHHGGGLARSPYSRRSLGSAHAVLRRLKDAFDPAHILNPGKLGLDDAASLVAAGDSDERAGASGPTE